MSKKVYSGEDKAALNAHIEELQKKYAKKGEKAREDVSMRLRIRIHEENPLHRQDEDYSG